jgi:hypothetical protein
LNVDDIPNTAVIVTTQSSPPFKQEAQPLLQPTTPQYTDPSTDPPPTPWSPIGSDGIAAWVEERKRRERERVVKWESIGRVVGG